MADIADVAQEHIEVALNASLQTALNANKNRLPPKGSCYFCREPLEGNELFCDLDCSSDYEKERRNIKV